MRSERLISMAMAASLFLVAGPAVASHVAAINVYTATAVHSDACSMGGSCSSYHSDSATAVAEGLPGSYLSSLSEDGVYNGLATSSLIWDWAQTGDTFVLTVNASVSAFGDVWPCPAGDLSCQPALLKAYSNGRASSLFTSAIPSSSPTGLFDYSISVTSTGDPYQHGGPVCGFYFVSAANFSSCNFSESGQLNPSYFGDSVIAVNAWVQVGQQVSTYGSKSASISVTLTLTPSPVPLPGAAWLAGTGFLACLAAARRRVKT